MPDILAPTVRLFVPKLGRVCEVNAVDAAHFRGKLDAIDESTYTAQQAENKAASERAAALRAPSATGTGTGSGTAPVRPPATPKPRPFTPKDEQSDANLTGAIGTIGTSETPGDASTASGAGAAT